MGLGDETGDLTLRRERFERSAALFRETGDRAQLPVVLSRLAWLYLRRGAYAEAQPYAEESFALTEEVGDVMGAAWMLKLGGDLALAQENYSAAGEKYRAALERFQALGSKSGIADALYGMGNVYRAEGHIGEARRMWEQALDLYRAMEQKKAVEWLLAQLADLAGA
jgi:tetratricopeptide (TPR) repeat protein